MKKYLINDTDVFHAASYPVEADELRVIRNILSTHACGNKGEMVISFAKDHSLKNDWIQNCAVLANVITSRNFKIANLELLFESCRDQKTFRRSLENYISDSLQ